MKVEALDASNEEYKQLQKEMEKLKREREEEEKEVVNLRWFNACLRHELDKERQKNKEIESILKEKVEGSEEATTYEKEHDLDACFGSVQSDGVCSKKNKLLRRMKRWVEGSDKAKVSPVVMEKDGHERFKTASNGEDKTPVVSA